MTDETDLSKLYKKIEEQQETLKPFIENAQHLGVKNLERWKQDVLLLSDEDVQELKTAIKEAREDERKRAIEMRRKEREAWKKPRDDLLCDDLKPLPDYTEFRLPSWVPQSIYGDLFSLHNFFCSFSELMPDYQGEPMFSLSQLASAVMSQSVTNQVLVDVFKALLNARRDLITDEDGDEADVKKSGEIGNELVCDLDHRVHGQRIRDINKKHEMIRNCHGSSVREFRINQSTVSEVVRLSLETSGYYPINSSRAKRQQFRGGLHCFEDEGYLFVLNNPEIMQKLETMSIFELSAEERMAILKVFVQQLLSFQKYRDVIGERINQMNELRRELKLLHQWNREQRRAAREAHQAKDTEMKVFKDDDEPKESDIKEEVIEETKSDDDAAVKALSKMPTADKKKKRPSKELLNLRSYLRLLNEGKQKRIANTAEMKRIIMEYLSFEEMDLREINESRELQKEFMKEKLDELLKQIYCLQARMGACYLGRDRAYRSYFFLHKYEMFIIEKPGSSSQFDCSCTEATPISKIKSRPRLEPLSEDIEDNILDSDDVEIIEPVTALKKKKPVEIEELSPDEERKKRLACTGLLQACPVHTINPHSPKFFYFVKEDGIEELLSALNPRGFREIDLCENISFLKDIYSQKMAKLFEKSLRTDFLRRHLDMRELSDEQDEDVTEVLSFRFRSTLLQIERKIYEKRLGNVSCSTTREHWRSSLEETGDTSKFCRGNQLFAQYSNGDVLYSSEDLNGELSEVQRLGISMLQVMHGIQIDCYGAPFALEGKKKKGTIPSKEYILFQKELLKSRSLSALAVFLSTFERAVKWDHVKPLLFDAGEVQVQDFTTFFPAKTSTMPTNNPPVPRCSKLLVSLPVDMLSQIVNLQRAVESKKRLLQQLSRINDVAQRINLVSNEYPVELTSRVSHLVCSLRNVNSLIELYLASVQESQGVIPPMLQMIQPVQSVNGSNLSAGPTVDSFYDKSCMENGETRLLVDSLVSLLVQIRTMGSQKLIFPSHESSAVQMLCSRLKGQILPANAAVFVDQLQVKLVEVFKESDS